MDQGGDIDPREGGKYQVPGAWKALSLIVWKMKEKISTEWKVIKGLAIELGFLILTSVFKPIPDDLRISSLRNVVLLYT